MKHQLAILIAAIFCVGGLSSAEAAAPTMDLSHRHWHHHHHHHWYYWHHRHHHHWHRR